MVQGPATEQGRWMYKVVHSGGMRFAVGPSVDEQRGENIVPCGSIICAIEKHTPAGSSMTFVKLEGNLGWIFEASNSQELLDRLVDDNETMY
jgi:hypothetical protein